MEGLMAHTFHFDEETIRVLAFVERTTSYGVPVRVALNRAQKRFGLDRDYLRALRRLVDNDRSIDSDGAR